VKDWFNDVAKQIETVNFAGTGESFTHAELTDPFLTITGTAGADTLTGGDAYAETINGLGGNDQIIGGAGNDLITGGLGNDTLLGGAGNDRYFFRS
jgi:Ca2+-binding RTX toxin-like protein